MSQVRLGVDRCPGFAGHLFGVEVQLKDLACLLPRPETPASSVAYRLLAQAIGDADRLAEANE